MSTLTVDQEAQALLDAENNARLEAARQAVTERRERERQAAEHAAKLDALKARLAAQQDISAIDKLQAKQRAVNEDVAAAMTAHNAELAAIRDELQALGNLPAHVDLGSHENGYGLTIGNVVVRRQRVQTYFVTTLREMLRRFIPRGEINLERPSD